MIASSRVSRRPAAFAAGLLLLASTAGIPTALPRERATPPGKPAAKAAVPVTPAPTGTTAAATTPAVAHLRLWKTDLPDAPEVRLTWTPAGDKPSPARGKKPVAPNNNLPSSGEVARASAGYVFGEYTPVRAGRGTLAADANGRALASLPAELAPGSFHTLLLTPEDPAELIADDPAPGAGTGDFALRNLTPGLRDLRVQVGEDVLSARFAAPGGLLRMRGVRAAVQAIKTEGTDAQGKAFSWTTEADFARFPRQTLLVYPDAYGRIRPRMSVDGAAPATN